MHPDEAYDQMEVVTWRQFVDEPDHPHRTEAEARARFAELQDQVRNRPIDSYPGATREERERGARRQRLRYDVDGLP